MLIRTFAFTNYELRLTIASLLLRQLRISAESLTISEALCPNKLPNSSLHAQQ
ncbi:hypothetical protein Pjdr2_0877 [Paenibacillus sp. JDR-2]|nr:hypothetical protein Pjdr2_0877 [Paenibacillus sp. JDR-2]